MFRSYQMPFRMAFELCVYHVAGLIIFRKLITSLFGFLQEIQVFLDGLIKS